MPDVFPCGRSHKLPQFCSSRECDSCMLNIKKQVQEELNHAKRLPCGWTTKLPRFCKNRSCDTCPLNRKNTIPTHEQPAETGFWEAVTTNVLFDYHCWGPGTCSIRLWTAKLRTTGRGLQTLDKTSERGWNYRMYHSAGFCSIQTILDRPRT